MIQQELPSPLVGWQTVPQISAKLGIASSKLYSETAAARTTGEPWVQNNYVPRLGRSCWHIDTESEAFTALAARWKKPLPLHTVPQQRTFTRPGVLPFPPDEFDEPFSFDGFSSEDEPLMPIQEVPTETQGRADQLIEPWHLFCEMLHDLGLVVFNNALQVNTQDPKWRWQWGALAGNGYHTKTEAVFAALEARFHLSEQCPACTTAFTGKKAKPRNVWFG